MPSFSKRFQRMKKMNFLKIAWWFLPNMDAVNTILREKMTHDQYFGPLPALERAFWPRCMHISPFPAYNLRTKANTFKWVISMEGSRLVDAETYINF